MRTGRAWIAAASLLVWAAVAGLPATAETAPRRAFAFDYSTAIEVPAGAGKVELWLPYPMSDEHQKVSNVRVTAPAGYEIVREPTHGNSVLHLALAGPAEGTVEVRTSFDVERSEYRRADLAAAASQAPLPADAAQWLRAERRADAPAEIAGYHCWAEFYLRGYGWVPVDASEAKKHLAKKEYFFGALDENRVQLSVGRDLTLAPRQAGEPLNYFVYPYVEIDGKPAAKVARTFRFRDLSPRRRQQPDERAKRSCRALTQLLLSWLHDYGETGGPGTGDPGCTIGPSASCPPSCGGCNRTFI